MKYCPDCGSILEPNVKFCGNCGKATEFIKETISQSTDSMQGTSTHKALVPPVKLETKSKKRKLVLGLIVTFCLVVAVILYIEIKKSIDAVAETEAYESVGASFLKEGKYDKAIQCYEKAIELNPQDYEAYNDMGIAYMNSGSYEMAIESFEKTLSINPKLAKPYFNLSIAYTRKGEKEDPIAKNGDDDTALLCLKKAAKLGDAQAQKFLNDAGIDYSK